MNISSPKVPLTSLSLLLPFLLGALPHAEAATYSKADTLTLNKATDWVGAAAATTTSDIGVFDSNLSAAKAANLSLGGAVSIGSLVFENSMNGPVTIANGFTLSMVSTGTLNLSAANHDVTINANVATAPNIKVAEGRTLTLGGGGSGVFQGNSSGLGSVVFTGTVARSYSTGGNPIVNIGDPSTGVGGVTIGSNATLAAGGQFNLGYEGSGLMKMETASSVLTINYFIVGRGNNTNAKLLLSSGTINTSSTSPSAFLVGGAIASGTAILDMQGGAITLGNHGMALGTANGGAVNTQSTFLLSGGTASMKNMIFGGTEPGTGGAPSSNSTRGTADLRMSGGTLYLGSSGTATNATRDFNGIAVSGSNNFAYNIVLAGGTVGANANWSSSANMKLDTTNGPITFQAADANGVARNISLSGTLSNNGSVDGGLTKTGAGTLTLNAVNTYTGPTNIKSGTLAVGLNGSIANSKSISLGPLASQGTLDLSAKSSHLFGSNQTVTGYGSILIGSGKTVTISGTLAPGNSAGKISTVGNLTLSGTAVMELSETGGVAGTDFDQVSIDGTFTYGGALHVLPISGFDLAQEGSFQLFQFTSKSGSFNSVLVGATSLTLNAGIWTGANADSTYSYRFVEDTGTLAILAIPEPTTWAMLIGGFGMLLGHQRIRRKRIS